MDLRRPVRVSHHYTQSLIAPPIVVFPLLCPVRECDWVPGWKPGFVISESGFVERDCIFTTHSEDGEASWYVTEHDSQELAVEMLKLVPGFLATRLRIELEEADGQDQVVVLASAGAADSNGPADSSGPEDSSELREYEVHCRARIRYTHTALSPAGEAEVLGWDDARWSEFMEGWQGALNQYLARGRTG